MSAVYANGKRIKHFRMIRGWNQDGLAEAAACSLRTVQHAELGKRIAITTLRAIAVALKVEYADLLAAEMLLLSQEGAVEDTPNPAANRDEAGESRDHVAVAEDSIIAEITINRDPRNFSELERQQFLRLLGSVLELGDDQKVIVKWQQITRSIGIEEGQS